MFPHFVMTATYILGGPLKFHFEITENDDVLSPSTFADALNPLVNMFTMVTP